MISTAMPNPFPEAQRLIAVSIGKIQTSRAQRGGPNLHKSLMVSAVLHKARTQIMMDNFQAMLQARRQNGDSPSAYSKPVAQQQPPVAATPTEIEATLPTQAGQATCYSENKENEENTSSQQVSTRDCVYTDCKVLSENTSGNKLCSESTTTLESAEDCGKCLKRRLTDAVSESFDNACKRAKCDSESDSNTSTHEPMDCSQISSLVNRFNTGLSGLLTPNSTVQGEITQGHCDSLVSSCATELSKEVPSSVSESIARAAIALSV